MPASRHRSSSPRIAFAVTATMGVLTAPTAASRARISRVNRIPVHSRHVHVGQHDGIATRLPQRQCLDAIDGGIGRQAQQAELTRHHLAIHRMVVHHQHAVPVAQRPRSGFGPMARPTASVPPARHAAAASTVKTEPLPGALSRRHVAVHQLGQPPHDRQAKAGAAEAARRRTVGLRERLEQSRAARRHSCRCRCRSPSASRACRPSPTGAVRARRDAAAAR